MRTAASLAACCLLLGLLAAPPAPARSPSAQTSIGGFPRLDKRAETILVGVSVKAPASDTHGKWTQRRGHVAPDVRKASVTHYWFPQGPDARVGDGFVRAHFKAGRDSLGLSLLLRASFDPNKPTVTSGYAVSIRRGRVELFRWDRGSVRPMGVRHRIGRVSSVEIIAWMVGPHLHLTVYDGRTLEPLAALTAHDSKYPVGRVGFAVRGKGARNQALKVLSVRQAGKQGDARDSPTGRHRFARVPSGMLAALPAELQELATLMEPDPDTPGMEIVRSTVTGLERIARAEVPLEALAIETPYKYINEAYREQRRLPPEATETGFRTDQSYKNAEMLAALLGGYAQRFPEITQLVEIGRSGAGRPILALKISDNAERQEDEPAVLLNGCHHGNELLALEFALDAAQTLVEGYANDKDARRWVDGLEIWVVPLVNPDGNVAYLERSIYSGRKNASDTNGNGRFDPSDGVDLNRNYLFRWGYLGEVGSNSSEDHHWFRGRFAGSEPETQAMMRLTDAEHFVASLSYHTVSTVILAPYTTDQAANPRPNEAWIVAEEVAAQTPVQPNGRRMRVRRNIYSVDGVDQDHFRAAHGTVALLVEGAYHNPGSQHLRLKTVAATRPTWQALLDRAVRGPGIRGRVTDAQGKPLPAEVVVLEQAPQMDERWTARCRDGAYERMVPKAGTYTVKVALPGYKAVEQRVKVGGRELARLDVTLATSGAPSASAALSCGREELLSIDARCGCRQGECPVVGGPRWCQIDGTCLRAGATGARPCDVCDPTQTQHGWSQKPGCEG